MTFHVDSEVGRLRQVILHRPGLELSPPDPAATSTSLLFDDVMWADRAREEHDALRPEAARQGRHGAPASTSLLAEALDQPGARDFMPDELTTANRFGPALDAPLDELVRRAPAERSPSCSSAACSRTSTSTRAPACCWATSSRCDFLLTPAAQPPLPARQLRLDLRRAVGQPDGEAARASGRRSTPGGVRTSTRCSATPGCTSTTATTTSTTTPPPSRAATSSSSATARSWSAWASGRRRRASSSSPGSGSPTARSPRSSSSSCPRTRAFMHLDTAMTMIDRDAFIVYPFLPDELRCCTLEPIGSEDGDYKVAEHDELFPVVAEALGLDQVRAAQDPDRRARRGRASSGTTATTSWPSHPASSSGTSATPPPTRSCAVTASRSSPSPAPSSDEAAAARAA